MGWVKEFGQEYKIPQSVLALLRDGITKDMSWGNDLAPSFGVYLEKGERHGDKKHDVDIRLFVEHPDADQREERGSQRYTVSVTENGVQSVEEFSTNDVRAAIEMYKQALVSFLLPEDFAKAIRSWSREKLGAWYEDNVGYDPFNDEPKLTTEEVKKTVADLMWLHNGGSEAALEEITRRLI